MQQGKATGKIPRGKRTADIGHFDHFAIRKLAPLLRQQQPDGDAQPPRQVHGGRQGRERGAALDIAKHVTGDLIPCQICLRHQFGKPQLADPFTDIQAHTSLFRKW